MIEVDALAGQLVQMGGLDIRIAVDAEGIPALLVGVEDQDIGTTLKEKLRRDSGEFKYVDR